MEDIFQNNPSYVISEAALGQKGRFSVDVILKSVKDRIIKYFNNSVQELTHFIVRQLDIMCEFGLIGKTSLYYFSMN